MAQKKERKKKNKQKPTAAAAFEYVMTTGRPEQTALLCREYYLLKLHLKYLSLYRWPLSPVPYWYPGRLPFEAGGEYGRFIQIIKAHLSSEMA